MTPTYTLDHVRAALGDDAADKVRDYVAPSSELRLARECAAKVHLDRGEDYSAELIDKGSVDDSPDYGVSSALLALQRRHELDTPDEYDAIQQAAAWLRECSSWLLTNDFDMACPMEADPLDLADNLGAIIAYKPEPGK